MRLFSAAILTLVISCYAFGQTYTIKTFAGGGLPVNIPGTSARLHSPYSVAVDGAGNLFFTDQRDAVLRLDAATGVLTLFAGNGTQGFSGDNGPATSARLNIPRSVAVDASGDLYIADSLNCSIRKVSSGLIATVAGNGRCGKSGDNGPATSTQLSPPYGIAVDAAGNLYIAESGNHRIRKVSNGVITTVAGNGTQGFTGDDGPASSARLNNPQGVAVDAAGNLYIADFGNNRIRKVSDGVITTVAGSGTQGFSGDNGPATSARLFSPYGVAVDAAGNLYIADFGNNRIRKVSDGVITTVAVSGTQGFSGDNGAATSARLFSPCGIAADAAGNLYFGDCQDDRIRKVSNGVITTVAGTGTQGGFSGDNGPATSAPLNDPGGIAVDVAGNLYFADSFNYRIRKVSKGVITTVAGNGMREFSGDNGPAISAQLNTPSDVAVDAAGNLYIADGSSRIRKVSNGVITSLAGGGTFGTSVDNGPATGGYLNFPVGVAVDAAGNLYIADYQDQRIRKLSNGVITTVAGNGSEGFSGDNGPATSGRLSRPAGITVDVAENLYIADSDNDRIRKVSNGVITTVAGTGTPGYGGDGGPATHAQLNGPIGVAVDAAGNLYIADYSNHRIRKVSNGVITTVAGNGSDGFSGDNGPATRARLNYPRDVAVDAAGNVYIADSRKHRIRILIPSGPSCSASVTPPALEPAAAGGSLAVTIQTASSCAWAIQSLPDWITFSASAVAAGPCSVTLRVAANPGAPRTATVSIAGVSIPVSQQGTR